MTMESDPVYSFSFSCGSSGSSLSQLLGLDTRFCIGRDSSARRLGLDHCFLLQFVASASSRTLDTGLGSWFSVVVYSIWKLSNLGARGGYLIF